MANRYLFHRKHLDSFIKWLGERSLPTKGQWEVARWKNNSPGKPMCIVFNNIKSPEHLSMNDSACYDFKRFIKEYKEQK
jgi:formylglycine-generating enzyme required for sulfatase activity